MARSPRLPPSRCRREWEPYPLPPGLKTPHHLSNTSHHWKAPISRSPAPEHSALLLQLEPQATKIHHLHHLSAENPNLPTQRLQGGHNALGAAAAQSEPGFGFSPRNGDGWRGGNLDGAPKEKEVPLSVAAVGPDETGQSFPWFPGQLHQNPLTSEPTNKGS